MPPPVTFEQISFDLIKLKKMYIKTTAGASTRQKSRGLHPLGSLRVNPLQTSYDIRVSGLVSIYFPLVTQWVFKKYTRMQYDYFAVGSLLVNPVGVVPETSVECLHRQLSLYIFFVT